METKTKLIIGFGSAAILGLVAYFTHDSWMPKSKGVKGAKNSDGTNNAEAVLANGMATNDQFEALTKKAEQIGSDVFDASSASSLSAMRKTFTTRVTYKEAETLTDLLGTKQSDWSVNDRIAFDDILKKWKGTPKATVATTHPTSMATKGAVGTYDILTDKDYDAKVIALAEWRNGLMAKQKKGVAGIFQKNLPSEKSFDKKFLPMSLSDIKQYASLQLKDKKDRSTKEETILSVIRSKYPPLFKGITRIYSFDGTESDLSNADLVHL